MLHLLQQLLLVGALQHHRPIVHLDCVVYAIKVNKEKVKHNE